MNKPFMKTNIPPKYYIYFSIACEKLSVHAVRYMLVLYATKSLLLSDSIAYSVNGGLLTLTYLSAIFGGYLGEEYFSNYKCSLIGASLLFYGIISIIIPFKLFFFIGLGFIACGGGFLRANLPALFWHTQRTTDALADSQFTTMYAFINLGALLSVFLCCLIGEMVDWKYGFISAGIIALLSFLALKHGEYVLNNENYNSTKEINSYLSQDIKGILFCLLVSLLWGLAIYNGDIIPYILLIFIFIALVILLRVSLKVVNRYNFVLLFLGFMIINTFFFAFYEQGPSSINLFIDRTVDKSFLFGNKAPTTLFQALDPIFNIILGVSLSYIWSRINIPSAYTIIKVAFGIIALGLSFYILYYSASHININGLINPSFILLAYFFLILGEELVVPISMSMISKNSPEKHLSLLFGIWNVSIATGQFLSAIVAKKMAIDDSLINADEVIRKYGDVFEGISKISFVFGIILLLIVIIKFFKRRVYSCRK
jgi:POT family proton-dependent oligopeptide transporter